MIKKVSTEVLEIKDLKVIIAYVNSFIIAFLFFYLVYIVIILLKLYKHNISVGIKRA